MKKELQEALEKISKLEELLKQKDERRVSRIQKRISTHAL